RFSALLLEPTYPRADRRDREPRRGHHACPSETRAAQLSSPTARQRELAHRAGPAPSDLDALRAHGLVVARRKLLSGRVCLAQRARAVFGRAPNTQKLKS